MQTYRRIELLLFQLCFQCSNLGTVMIFQTDYGFLCLNNRSKL